MRLNPFQFALLVVAMSASAGAVPQETPSAQNPASPRNNAPAQINMSSAAKERPTAAQLAQPGAIVMPPPILRNAGTTYVSPDQPVLGRLTLQGQIVREPLRGFPPAMQPTANEAVLSGTSDIGVVGRPPG